MNGSAAGTALLEQALAAHRAGALAQAESLYQRVLKQVPGSAHAWQLAAVCAYQQEQFGKAAARAKQSLSLDRAQPSVWNNLALALKAQEQHKPAQEALEEALRQRPNYPDACFNLGGVFQALGNDAMAAHWWQRCLALQGHHLGALTNLGLAQRRAGNADEAIALLQRAHALANTRDSQLNLCLALLDGGQLTAAREHAQALCQGDGADATAWEALAHVAQQQSDHTLVETALARACALAANDGSLQLQHALALSRVGADQEARAARLRAQRLSSKDPQVRIQSLLLTPALIPDDYSSLLQQFADELEQLAHDVEKIGARTAMSWLDAFAGKTWLDWHYLPQSVQHLQRRLAETIEKTAAKAHPEWMSVNLATRRPGPARVGFVGAYWHRHSVSRFFANFVLALDPARFETWLWHTATDSAPVAEELRSFPSHWCPRPRASWRQLAEEIRAQDLDVLVFSDLGMDPRNTPLAALRLARRQILLYGHPASSGLSILDGYISGAGLEPSDADSSYSEPLVRLPDLGAAPQAWFEPPDQSWFQAMFAQHRVALVTQNLQKITPEWLDAVLRLSSEHGLSLAFFDRLPALSQRFLAQLEPKLRSYGVPQQHVHMIKARSYREYLGAVQAADLLLDTAWFSGGATSLDALAVGRLPVAWRGPFARGRQTCAMLDICGRSDLIADDEAHYRQLAARLLATPELGQHGLLPQANPIFADHERVLAAWRDHVRSLCGVD